MACTGLFLYSNSLQQVPVVDWATLPQSFLTNFFHNDSQPPRVFQQVGVRLRWPLRIRIYRGGEERLDPLQEPGVGGHHRRRPHRQRLLLSQPLRRRALRGRGTCLQRGQSGGMVRGLAQPRERWRRVRGAGLRGGAGPVKHPDEHDRERREHRHRVLRGGARRVRGEPP